MNLRRTTPRRATPRRTTPRRTTPRRTSRVRRLKQRTRSRAARPLRGGSRRRRDNGYSYKTIAALGTAGVAGALALRALTKKQKEIMRSMVHTLPESLGVFFKLGFVGIVRFNR